jgi:hypothetical protein
MTRTTFAATLPLVAVLALASPRSAVAGPPESPVGAMQLDKVEDGLRQYRQQKADDKRVAWLKRLAPSHDPRVEWALVAARLDSSEVVAAAAGELLDEHYGRRRAIPDLPPLRLPPPTPPPPGPPET